MRVQLSHKFGRSRSPDHMPEQSLSVIQIGTTGLIPPKKESQVRSISEDDFLQLFVYLFILRLVLVIVRNRR